MIDDFQQLTEEQLMKEIENNPSLPCDYIDFLKEVGYGYIEMDGYLFIFSGAINPKLIYKALVDRRLIDILYFGDDLNGYYCGFQTSDNWKVVEVDDLFNIRTLNMGFESYIRKKVNDYLKRIDN
jgi:hypothetical protein